MELVQERDANQRLPVYQTDLLRMLMTKPIKAQVYYICCVIFLVVEKANPLAQTCCSCIKSGFVLMCHCHRHNSLSSTRHTEIRQEDIWGNLLCKTWYKLQCTLYSGQIWIVVWTNLMYFTVQNLSSSVDLINLKTVGSCWQKEHSTHHWTLAGKRGPGSSSATFIRNSFATRSSPLCTQYYCSEYSCARKFAPDRHVLIYELITA